MYWIGFLNRTAFYWGALVVSFFCITYEMIQGHTDRPRNRIFLWALMTLVASSICDMVYVYNQNAAPYLETANFLYRASCYLYFIIHNLLGMLLFFYTLFATQNFQRLPYPMIWCSLIPFCVSELLILFNPITGWVYHYGERMAFIRGWGEYTIFFSGVFYMGFSMFIMLCRWNGLTRRKKTILIFALVVTSVCLALQFMYEMLQLELFGEAVTFIGIMLAIEYDKELSDPITGLGNRQALIRDMSNLFEQGHPFSAIALRAVNLDTTCRIYHLNTEKVAESAAGFLKQKHLGYMIYRMKTDSFVLILMRKTEEYRRALLDEIRDHFGDEFTFEGEYLPVRSYILSAQFPGKLKGMDELMIMCEGDLDLRARTGGMLTEKELDTIFARATIDRAIHLGIAEHKFLVRYQPVFSADGKKIDSAEALIRHANPDFGAFGADGVIRIAERNGTILELGDYILREVCTFLDSGVPAKCGISQISINLSALQCVSPEFSRRVEDIVASFPHVHPQMLCFEIMEAESIRDYTVLSSVINDLKKKGYSFSMEGYGSGFSNMYAVFTLDFDMVKLDKSLLWEAEKNEVGRVILENSIKTIHDIHRKVTVVGVESDEQLELVRPYGVDALQGFYFAKPLTEEQLIEMYAVSS